MLVIANGAFKSGSTWLREIILNVLEFQDIPPEYRNPTLPHWIDTSKLQQFVDDVDYVENNYITKAHLLAQSYVDLLVGVEGVRVLSIRRDVRDVIVSHYHHLLRDNKGPKNFKKYYYSIGRYKAHQLRIYHQLWDIPGVYCSTFELLKSDFSEEVMRIAEFLGQQIDERRIEEIKKATSLENLRNPGSSQDRSRLPSSQFFRSGKVGDWGDFFDKKMEEDVRAIEMYGLKGIALIRYHVLFTLRGKIKSILSNRAAWLDRLLIKF